MSNYRLVDIGVSSFKQIMHGRTKVGRVCQHTSGGYLGAIGQTTARAMTEVVAFEEVVAKHLGYPSAAALNQKITEARRAKARSVKRGRVLAQQFLSGNVEQQLDIIQKIESVGGAVELVSSVRKAMFK